MRSICITCILSLLLLITGPSYSQNPPSKEKEIEVKETMIIPAAGCENGKPLSNFEIPLKDGPQPRCINRGKPSFLRDRKVARGDAPTAEVGTVIVLSVSSEQIILAADSRGGVYQKNEFKKTSDKYCKLVQLTPSLLFAASGWFRRSGRMPANVAYDAQQLARQAATRFVFDPNSMEPNHTIEEIAAKWAWDLAYRINRGISGKYYQPLDVKTWIVGVFAGAEPSGELSVVVARLDYHQERAGWKVPIASVSVTVLVPPKDYTWIDAFGQDTVVKNYLEKRRQTERTKAEHARIRGEQLRNPSEFPPDVLQKLVELTYLEDPRVYQNGDKTVGGNIDIARLQKGKKIQWVNQKPACIR